MNDYKPNSHRFKEEQTQASATDRQIKPVVKGQVKLKKKSEITKFTDVFLAEDISTAKSYILKDVLLPGAKRLCRDIVVEFANTIFGTRGGGRDSDGPRVSYSKYYNKDDRRPSEGPKMRTRFNYDDIVFESRGEAEVVLDEMCNVLDRFKVISVADLYDMCGQDQPYTSNKYGWTNLRDAEVKRVSDGYVLKLPRALPID